MELQIERESSWRVVHECGGSEEKFEWTRPWQRRLDETSTTAIYVCRWCGRAASLTMHSLVGIAEDPHANG